MLDRQRNNNFILYWITAYLLRPIYSLLIKTKIEGEHFIPSEGPFIVVSNHISLLDPFALCYLCMRRKRVAHFLAKSELFKGKLFRSYLKSCGQIPVERNAANAADALKPAKDFLLRNHCVAIYPEATLSEDLKQLPIKSGAVRLAIDANVPIVVVGTWGAHEIQSGKHKPKLKFRVEHVMVVSKPYKVNPDISIDDARKDLAERMKQATSLAKSKRG